MIDGSARSPEAAKHRSSFSPATSLRDRLSASDVFCLPCRPMRQG